MAVNNPSGLVINNPQTGIQYTKVTDSSSDWTSVANSTYFYDIASAQIYYKNGVGSIISVYEIPFSASEIFRGLSFTNNSTTVNLDGGVVTSTTASNLAQSVASTNFATKQVRLRYYASLVSTGRYIGVRNTTLLWFMGGGFRYICDFNISDTAYGSGCRQFYGMAGQITDLGYSDSITVASLTNIIGVGSDSADTNLQVFYNDATGTASKIDLGTGFPANRDATNAQTTFYSITLYNGFNSNNVIYIVKNNETGAIAQGVLTSDLPASTQGLAFFASRCMGAAVTNTGQYDLAKLGVYSLL